MKHSALLVSPFVVGEKRYKALRKAILDCLSCCPSSLDFGDTCADPSEPDSDKLPF